MSVGRHVRAVLLLPGVVTLVVPALLVRWRGTNVTALGVVFGTPLIALGLGLVGWTIALFATRGRGTLAPWDVTQRLVVEGPYRHVRNPMISGVLAILLGEAAALGSRAVLAWAVAVFAVNAVYLPLVEEPGLARRFGPDYERYRANVRRWIPRARPWDLSSRR